MNTKHVLILAVLLIAACELAPDLSTQRAAVLTASRMDPRIVRAQRENAHVLAAGRITGAAAATMASTPDGSEYLSNLVACALPSWQTVTVSGIDYTGELGLAPTWAYGPLLASGRGWVSGCVLARMSGTAVALPISIRGPRPALDASPDERTTWSAEEGAFFGDLFTAPCTNLAWFACRGVDPATADRTCTLPDPDRPGLTLCGLSYAGMCSGVCDRSDGIYRDCDAGGRVFTQPITVYDAP